MKFSINLFEIDKEYDASIRNKIDSLRKELKNNKSISVVMITTYGIKQNKYSNIVSQQVLPDDLFVKDFS